MASSYGRRVRTGDPDTIKLVLLFLSRNDIQVVDMVDLPIHTNIFVRNGGLESCIGVFKSGAVNASQDRNELAAMLRAFRASLGNKWNYKVEGKSRPMVADKSATPPSLKVPKAPTKATSRQPEGGIQATKRFAMQKLKTR
jgi:hypothetical protein